MATRGRRYLSVTLETLLDDPQLLRHAPAPTATGVYHLETLNLETILMNSHKVSFAEPHRLWQAVLTGGVLINRFLDETNDNPKPFTWTADPDKIIAAVKRGHQVLDSIH